MLKKIKAVIICVVSSIIGLIGGLWIGYGFVMDIIPTPIANEGMLLFVYIMTGIIGLIGAVIGYSIGRAINEMRKED